MGPVVGGIVVGWLASIGLLAWKRWAGVAGASLMGLGVSIYLGVQHHPAMGSSFCSVSEAFDCDKVNRSVYSELAGIPIAFLGALFYAGVLALAIQRLRGADKHDRAAHLVTFGAILSVGYSVFLAWASTQVGAWCLFCISLYGVNTILLVAGVLLLKGSDIPFGSGVTGLLTANGEKSLGSFSTFGVIVFVACMGFYNSIKTETQEAQSSGDLSMLFEATYGPLELDGTEPIMGDPRAPYTVVEFADFQCPSCAATAPELERLVEEVPQVRVMFKHYPISGICNDRVEGDRHDKACQAAAAAECARGQGKFWQLERLLFINQRTLEKADIQFMAEQIGLDIPAFEACMTDPDTEAAVRKDVAHAHQVGVAATPSLFLKGMHGEDFVALAPGVGTDGIAHLVREHLKGTEIPAAPPAGSHGY